MQNRPIHTDICMEIPQGMFGKINPRSGLSVKHHIDTNAGVIDSDYRGEILVVLENNKTEDYEVHKGDKIAQIIFHHIPTIKLVLEAQIS